MIFAQINSMNFPILSSMIGICLIGAIVVALLSKAQAGLARMLGLVFTSAAFQIYKRKNLTHGSKI